MPWRKDFDSSWKRFFHSFYGHGVIITPQFLSLTHENKSQSKPYHKPFLLIDPFHFVTCDISVTTKSRVVSHSSRVPINITSSPDFSAISWWKVSWNTFLTWKSLKNRKTYTLYSQKSLASTLRSKGHRIAIKIESETYLIRKRTFPQIVLPKEI